MATRKATSRRKSKQEEETFTLALASYEKAMAALMERDWQRAGVLLSAFINEFADRLDVSEMVDRARLHLASCDERQAAREEDPTDAEGWLLKAVVAANDRDLDSTLEALDQADALGAPAARTRYVRAAALAVADRTDEALKSLAAAIEADPENRAFSLGDPDFERLRETAGYVSLVEPPDAGSGSFGDRMSHDQETGPTGFGSL